MITPLLLIVKRRDAYLILPDKSEILGQNCHSYSSTVSAPLKSNVLAALIDGL